MSSQEPTTGDSGVIRVRADALLYPAIFFGSRHIRIWRDSESAGYLEGSGLLVDAGARCYRLIGSEDPFMKDGRWLSRDARRRVEYRGLTLLCDGESFVTSVEDLKRKIVWLVSARGHFESPEGFGLPAGLETASTVATLLNMLPNIMVV